MLDRKELLEQINLEIPADVDWRAGAQRYVASLIEKYGRLGIEKYSMNKPFGEVGEDPTAAIAENVHYLYNFVNAIDLIKPKLGARVLDVACGGGWVSNYMSKMGYWTYGVDISSDFIDLAKKRLLADATLDLSSTEVEGRFSVVDLETERLPDHLRGTFDIVWLESCLHHFVDPIQAMEHLAEALKPDGIIVLIEFENRRGCIKDEYMQVMREFDTLERPFSREQLARVLQIAGVLEYEFVGTLNGWISPDDPKVHSLSEILINGAAEINLAICAKQRARLDSIFPHRISAHSRLLNFGQGFYGNEGGFRWCAPSGEFTATRDIEVLDIVTVSVLPPQSGLDQLVVAYGAYGEVGRVVLTPSQPSGRLMINRVEKGERVTVTSTLAFRPSWTGSVDTRLLSFYFKVEE